MQDFFEILFHIFLPMGFGYLLGRIDCPKKKQKKCEIVGEDFLRAKKNERIVDE